MNLLHFEKPPRYINNEINSIKKEGKNLIKFGLSFPDIYEIGMSHVGLKILYHILNKIPDVYAERIFSPWIDMFLYLKNKNIPLTSLESKRPIKDFDILGFSLQYELSYPAVLNILSLGHIPLKWQDRLEKKYPLIVCGGPCTVNPLPLSPFIDAFLIGDGEEAIIDLVNVYREWQRYGNKKEELLKEIDKIKGFYVPFVGKTLTKRRIIENLNEAPFPDSPVLPYMKIIHDRLSIEVSRGCPSGCRFCQAGFIYRPLRYRTPEKILNIAENSINNTGYEEISLLSFSIGQYPYLIELIDVLNKKFHEQGIAISLPSIRADRVTENLVEKIKFTRKTGFTIAPEAATERLRNLINKNISNEDIEKACSILFQKGWLNIKLYFMIGLPTEDEQDIEEIVSLSKRIIKIARTYSKKFVDINVTVSPFIPKPHTPFQWLSQIPFEQMKRRLEFIKKAFNKSKIHYKGHSPEMSILEAALSRGDEKVGEVIHRVWLNGEFLSAWTDLFDFNRWIEAMDETGVDLFSYSSRQYSLNQELPWDFIFCGVSKEFLKDEFKKAFESKKTDECNVKCEGCGIKECKIIKRKALNIKDNRKSDISYKLIDEKNLNTDQITIVRICHTKLGNMRYLSQLEMGNLLLRSLRMAKIPIVLSKGFSPKPEISFGPSLPVGIESDCEFFDLKIYGEFKPDYIEKINKKLPEGLKIISAKEINDKTPSLESSIRKYIYQIKLKNIIVPDFDNLNSKTIQRKEKTFNLRDFIENIRINHDELCIIVKDGEIKARISEIVETLLEVSSRDLEIKRLAMYEDEQILT